MTSTSPLKLSPSGDSQESHLALLKELKTDVAPLQVTADLIEEESGVTQAELKSGFGLVRVILGYVVADQYSKATRSLEDYIAAQHEYPDFAQRVERYRQHCTELVSAIKVKREVATAAGLSNAKQHELSEKVYHHFRELKSYLDKIEKCLREIKMEDARATVWFVKALCLGLGGIFSVLLAKEVLGGQLLSVFYVTKTYIDQGVDLLFNLF